jgi:hypothetical protein
MNDNESKIDNLPIKDIDIGKIKPIDIKELNLKPSEEKIIPPEIPDWNVSDALPILKKWLVKEALILLGKEKGTFADYIKIGVVLLVVLSIIISSILPKCAL